MQRSIIGTAALLAFALASGTATAATASTTVSDLKIQLIDLAPNDGVAPFVTFHDSATTARTDQNFAPNGLDNVTTHIAAGGFAPVSAQDSPNPYGDALASLTGDVLGDGARITTTVRSATPDTGTSHAFEEGSIFLYDYATGAPINFLLSPDTRMVLSGFVDIVIDSTNSGSEGYAYGVATLSVQGSTLDNTSQDRFLVQDFTTGVNQHDEVHQAVSLTFTNLSDLYDQSGIFSGFVQAVAITNVPEPANASLLAAGLGVIGLAFRRAAISRS
jgi:hypothetical protein